MNKQGKIVDGKVVGGIEWTKTVLPDGTESQGYTWNPVGGCKHACRWTMPDGSIAICYAESTANTMRSDKFYPDGFEHHYWHPDRLDEPLKLKKPAKIFLDSMSDLMGHWVPDEQVEAVLDVARRAPQHTFQLLTKNAPRLLKFNFPPNVWVGVSAPPSHFMGRPLNAEQQRRYVFRALDVLAQLTMPVRWFSIEPLSFDFQEVLEAWARVDGSRYDMHYLPLEWVVIGAATNGPKVYQPEPEWVRKLLVHLCEHDGIPVFFKGNLRGNPAADPWLEEFPE